jgi:hypothetical protein
VGLFYLTDLLYLLNMPDFWECLNEPVIDFLREVYGNQNDESFSDFRSEISWRQSMKNSPKNGKLSAEQIPASLNQSPRALEEGGLR